jgi:phosphoribosylformylglycinamidine synthase subunit PurL
MVGLVPDITKICGQSWVNPGDIIYLLGYSHPTLSASEYLATVHNIVAGKPPVVDFELERNVQAVCCQGIRQGWIQSAHDLAEGGLAVALAEACIGNNLGATINIPVSESQRLDEVLFGEVASQIVVSVKSENIEPWEAYLQNYLADRWLKIGNVEQLSGDLNILTNDNLSLINVKIEELAITWTQAIESRLVPSAVKKVID